MNHDPLSHDPNLPFLMLVAQSLGELCESLVFVGGCAAGLLLTSPRAQASQARLPELTRRMRAIGNLSPDNKEALQ